MVRKSEERSLQITSKSWFDWSLPDVLAIHVANEVYFGEDRDGAVIQMSLLKKMGFLPGTTDWLLFWIARNIANGDPFNNNVSMRAAIELKIDTELSPKQKEFRDKWVKTGGLYAECRSMKEIEAAVKGWGLKPKYPIPIANAESRRQMRQYAAFDMFKPLEPRLPTVNLTNK